MIHKLARKHYHAFAGMGYPLPEYKPDLDIAYLNFNTNSFGENLYRFYPNLGDYSVAKKYLRTLEKLANVDSDLNERNILFTQGSAGAIDLIIRVFCEPGKDAILVSSPTFLYYGYRALLENVEVIDVPLIGDNYNILNMASILNQKNAKVFFICSPNNPVGTSISGSQIEEILERFNGMVVLDEAYIEWTEKASFFSRVKQYDNLIVLRTFSKFWGLAGIRCGAAIANQSTIDVLSLGQTMFAFADSTADHLTAQLDCLKKLLDARKEMVAIREDFQIFLKQLPYVKKVFPGESNFLLVQFEDGEKVVNQLLKNKIVVQDTSRQVPQSLRISIGTKLEMERLKEALREMR